MIAGILIACAGVAAAAGWIPALATYTYPITWWGLLIAADSWNARRSGQSLWRGRLRHFLLITLPLSVLFWLLFEVLNLFSPQWGYRGEMPNAAAWVLFGFVSFATVIPIMAEAHWLVMGRFRLPGLVTDKARAWKPVLFACGALLLAIPLFKPVFWFSQGMWIAPALFLLPYLGARDGGTGFQRLLPGTAGASLLAGFLWELINYWSPAGWEYLILPATPHLFAMPLPGYLGFIPFGLTTMVVYEWQLRRKPHLATGLLLYAGAFVILYVLVAR